MAFLCAFLPCLPMHAQATVCDVFGNRSACRLFGSDPTVARVSNRGATLEAQCEGELPHARGLGGGASVWWVWQAPQPGYAVVSTFGSDFDTVLGVYAGKELCDFDPVAHNDDESPDQRTSRVGFEAHPNEDYQIVVAGKEGQTGEFGLQIRLYTCPEILVEPRSQQAAERTEVEFSVEALGASPMWYQWQHRAADGGPGFAPLAGETNAWLRLTASTSRAGEYRVVITNPYCQVSSDVAVLELQSTPEITQAPQPGAVVTCDTYCFMVSAVGGLPLTNRWQFRRAPASDWEDRMEEVSFSGASTFCLADVRTDQAGEYRVLVANGAGAIQTAPVSLWVLSWPAVITQDPADQLGFEGETARFEVGIHGPSCEPTAFHWRYRPAHRPPGSAVTIQVTQTPELSLPNLTSAQAGLYSVLVSNRYGATLPSAEAQLTVARRPPNDHFSDRVLLLSTPATAHGSNQHATAEPGEPGHGDGAARHSVWWAYRAPRLGVVSIDLAGSSFEPRVGVYTGPALGDLATVALGGRTAVFLARPEEEYYIAVDSAEGSTGEIVLRLELRDDACPEWRSEPSGFQEVGDFGGGVGCRTRALRGEAVSLTPVSYQWLFHDEPIAGATNDTLRLERLTTDDAGEYRLVARNAACVVTSRVARVEVLVGPRIVVEPALPVTPLPLCTNLLWLEVVAESCRLPVHYQWRHEGLPIPGATNATWTIASPDPASAGNYDVVVSNPNGAVVSRTVWFEVESVPPLRVTPPHLEHALCSDVLLQLGAGTCLDVTYQWRQDGQPVLGANGPALLLANLSPAQVGAYDLLLRFGETTLTSRVSRIQLSQPSLRREPDLPTYELCQSVRLFVNSADCEGVAQYQWRRDGAPLPGATNATLTLEMVTPTQAGQYDVVITVGSDAVISAPAAVAVAGAPLMVRQPGSVTVTNCGPASFCVEARSSACVPPRFQWFKGPTGDSATNRIAGATEPCLAFDRVAPEDAGAYRVEVRTAFATNVSQAVALTVLAQPRITLDPSPPFERVRAGGVFTNEVQVESCPPQVSYRWFRDAVPVNLDAHHVLEPNGWLVVRNATVQDSGNYHCVVDNGLGSATSGTSAVRVVVPPPNDDFANRITLSGTNILAETYADGGRYHNELATAEPGEIGLPGHPPARTVWWTWTAPTPGRVTLDLSGSTDLTGGGFDTLLGVFEGDRLETLRLVAQDDNSGVDGLASRVSFLAAKGRTFHFVVDGKAQAEGLLRLRLTEEEIISPPVIQEHPYSLAAGVGETATFTVKAFGSPDLLYQWFKDGAAIPGATNATLEVADVQAQDAGSYLVQIRNDYPPATNSHAARLTLGTIIRGQVTDATNDQPIPGARVSVGTLSTLTDAFGRYELIGVEPGGLTADFDAERKRGHQVVVGLLDEVRFVDRSTLTAVTLRCEKRPEYTDFEDRQFEPPRGRAVTNEISMSPVLTGMRFVLNWGPEPADLDLALGVRSPEGYWQVDYLWVGQGGSNAPPYVTFDVDARQGFGPETITLHRLLSGTYSVYVRKFGERARGSLPTSGASVRVYQYDPDLAANQLVGVREVPTVGTGNYWLLCDVDGDSGVVRWRNQLVDAPPGPSGVSSTADTPPDAADRLSAWVGPVLAAGRGQPVRHGAGLADVEYEWRLGDGVVRRNESEPVHAYAVPGCKDVELRLVQAAGTNVVVSVASKACFVQVTNGPPEVAIRFPGPHWLFRAGDPIPLEIRAVDTDRQLAARRITSVELFRLEGTRTNLLTTWSAEPFTWAYPETTNPGTYVFVARAMDNHGAVAWSEPVPVEVRELSGDVLIVRPGPHAEIDKLLELLSRPSIPHVRADPNEVILELETPQVRVLDQKGLHFDLVRDFRLIIWDDAGEAGGALEAETVQVLLEAWEHGIPLYLIGQRLASATSRFTGPGAAEATAAWQLLSRLSPEGGVVEGCEVQLQAPDALFNELFRTSWHGDVLPFRAHHPVERAGVLADTSQFAACDGAARRDACVGDAQSRATCGSVPVLVRTPRIGQESSLRPLRLSQAFLVSGGGDLEAQFQRETLFLNSVLWLLRNTCAQRGPTLAPVEGLTEYRAATCDTLIVQAALSHHAECEETGVLVTASVSEGLQICGARVIAESPEVAPTVLIESQQVRFDFGLLRNGTQRIEVTLRACAPGSFAPRFELVSANRPPQAFEQPIVVEGAPCADCMPPLLTVAEAGDTLEISVAHPPTCPARLEVSQDLRTWAPVPEGDSPWTWRLPVASQTHRFYRLSPVP